MVWTGQGVTAAADVLISGSEITKAHQCLSGENLQQGDEVVSISEVLVQVGDVSLGLKREEETKGSQPCFTDLCRKITV